MQLMKYPHPALRQKAEPVTALSSTNVGRLFFIPNGEHPPFT